MNWILVYTGTIILIGLWISLHVFMARAYLKYRAVKNDDETLCMKIFLFTLLLADALLLIVIGAG